MIKNTSKWIIVLIMLSVSHVYGNCLQWESPGDQDLQGYQVHIGTQSGEYSVHIDVGDVLKYELVGLEKETLYYVAVTAYDGWGNQSDYSEEVTLLIADTTVTTGLDEDASRERELSFALFQNYPNPFNPETHISYSVKGSGRLRLAVYNMRGELVKILADREVSLQGERSTVRWDGTNEYVMPVASGVYVCRLEQDGLMETRRMILTR